MKTSKVGSFLCVSFDGKGAVKGTVVSLCLPLPKPHPGFLPHRTINNQLNVTALRMDSVCSNSVHTPCIRSTDLLKDTNDFLQLDEDPYGDLLSYPSTSDDIWALSRNLRGGLQDSVQNEPLPRVSHVHRSNECSLRCTNMWIMD